MSLNHPLEINRADEAVGLILVGIGPIQYAGSRTQVIGRPASQDNDLKDVRFLASIGHPDMAEFGRSTHEARSFAELKRAVEKGLSTAGLMLFMQLDHGAILRKETGRETPKMIRFVIGNPLIMKEMVKHVPDAGSYAPVTVLVDERADGVHLSYDRMASFLAPYGNRDALEVARDLDKKIEDLLQKAAA